MPCSMTLYDPDQAPDPVSWLDLDEAEQVNLIVEYHRNSGQQEPEGGWELHAALHVIVENQLAMKSENVPKTVAKLIRQGLSRHDAVHAIGAVIGSDIFAIAKHGESFNAKKYRKRLDKLTAKRWRQGKW